MNALWNLGAASTHINPGEIVFLYNNKIHGKNKGKSPIFSIDQKIRSLVINLTKKVEHLTLKIIRLW